MTHYKTESDIEAVVRGFESCSTDKAAFGHREHLTVAAWYLSTSTVGQAAEKIRLALWSFLDHHGVGRGKYNETITVFWIEMVAGIMRASENETSVVEKCNRVVELLSDPALVFAYYTGTLLWSDEARHAFVEPDLKEWRRV